MIPEEVQKIAGQIGEYFLCKNNHDYQATAEEIYSLRVSKIIVDGNKVEITLGRPGLLIGKRGVIIDGLAKWLSGMEVKIIEDTDCINDFLIPVDWSEVDRI